MVYIKMALFFISVLIAYFLGRRIGRKEGKQQAGALLPLILRRQAMTTGRCPICGSMPSGEATQESVGEGRDRL